MVVLSEKRSRSRCWPRGDLAVGARRRHKPPLNGGLHRVSAEQAGDVVIVGLQERVI
jgi:hypothetical protein